MNPLDNVLAGFHPEACADIFPLAACENMTQAEFDGYGSAYVAETGGFLCLFMPYVPHVVPEPSAAFIDSYYWVSQKIYRLKKEILGFLAPAYPDACTFEGSYKALVFSLGIGKVLRNTLIWIKPFGSFFCMEVIDLYGKGSTALPARSYSSEQKGCANCGRCETACPTGALRVNDFQIDKCVRQKQFEKADLNDPMNCKYGNRLLGCNECQSVCPMNAGVVAKSQRPSGEYYKMFDLDEFALACCSPGFKSSEYAKIYGANYAKPMKILGQILVAMKNDDPQAHVEAVKKCLALGNPNEAAMLGEWLEMYA